MKNSEIYINCYYINTNTIYIDNSKIKYPEPPRFPKIIDLILLILKLLPIFLNLLLHSS